MTLRLRHERTRRAWSLVKLCGLTAISPSDLSRVERGLVTAHPAWRRRISAAFELPESYLFTPADPQEPTAAPTPARELVSA